MKAIRINRNSRKRQLGVTIVELVATFLILAFVSLGTIQLYRVGDKTQRTARFYSDAQEVAREALRRMVRTMRHGSAVVVNSTETNFSSAPSSDTTQIIVATPRSGGSGSDYIRFYLSGTDLYAQRQDDSGSGTKIATGVTTMSINYYATTVTTSGVSRSRVNGSPSTATEADFKLEVKSGTVTTTEVAYTSLRNKDIDFLD